MALRFNDWLPDFFGLQSVVQTGAQQVQLQSPHAVSASVECTSFFDHRRIGYESCSLSIIKNNLAVVPIDWTREGVSEFSRRTLRPWFSLDSHHSFTDCMTQLKETSFIAFDEAFLDFIGRDAKLELVHTFTGEDAKHVHEAPVYVQATDELVFADTSVIGWLWALQVKSHKIRRVNTNPPLENVNGATIRDGRIYATTNGGRAPGIWSCEVPSGVGDAGTSSSSETTIETINCIPIVNNYRLNHLNSPNDLIFTSTGNILFTDPTYGWAQSWPGIGPPELPTATYHFNTKTGALIPLDNDLVLEPNGLALSGDHKTLYIADSNSTSGKPIGVWNHSVRNVYAFDFEEASLTLKNKRLVHMVEAGWPDGLRVTKYRSGGKDKELVLVATNGGVDVVDVSGGGAGILLGKCNVGDDIVFNLEPVTNAAPKPGQHVTAATWLFTGRKGVYKLSINPAA